MIITSRQNPLIKHLAELYRSAKARREHDEFVCEGVRLLEDALANGIIPTAVIKAEGLAIPVMPAGTLTVTVPERMIETLSEQKTPQGVIFTVPRRVLTKPPEPDGRHILLDSVQNPGNVGAVIRSAEAFGFSVILTPGCADPFSPKAARAAMGAILRADIRFMPPVELVSIDIPLYAADTEGQDIREAGLNSGVIMIGGEGAGLSAELCAAACNTVSIPMKGCTESLNAAVAASILMWEMCR